MNSVTPAHALLFLLLSAGAAEGRVAGEDTEVRKPLVFEAEQAGAVEGFLFTTVEIPFRVRNTGEQPVRVLEVMPRRGAGRGVADPEVLAPGASGRVILRRQVTELGFRQYAFRVRTDDAENPDYPLSARVFGMSAYTPDLPGIAFDVARKGQVTAQRIAITSYETTTLELRSVLESPPWLEVRVVPRGEGESAQDLVLEARLLASAPPGLLSGSVHLLTNVAAQPDLVLPVHARVFDTVSVTPMPATLKPARTGETRRIELEYRSLDGKALVLESVADSTRTLRLEPRVCGPNCVKVDAEFKATRVGEFGGTISARFDQRDEPVDSAWDILVVSDTTVIRDLGTLGAENIEAEGSTGIPGDHR